MPTHRDFPDSYFDGDPVPRFLREQTDAHRRNATRRSPQFDALPDYRPSQRHKGKSQLTGSRPSPPRNRNSRLALAVIISAVLTYSHVVHL